MSRKHIVGDPTRLGPRPGEFRSKRLRSRHPLRTTSKGLPTDLRDPRNFQSTPRRPRWDVMPKGSIGSEGPRGSWDRSRIPLAAKALMLGDTSAAGCIAVPGRGPGPSRVGSGDEVHLQEDLSMKRVLLSFLVCWIFEAVRHQIVDHIWTFR